MAHAPMGDIKKLWDQTRERNWHAFHRTLEAHRDKAEGIDNTLILVMLRIVNTFEHDNRPYPPTVEQMYDLMNQKIEEFASQHPQEYASLD